MIRPLLLVISLLLSFPAAATISESHGYAQFCALKYTRSMSDYPHSEFSATGVPPGHQQQRLATWREQLPPALFTTPPYTLGLRAWWFKPSEKTQ